MKTVYESKDVFEVKIIFTYESGRILIDHSKAVYNILALDDLSARKIATEKLCLLYPGAEINYCETKLALTLG